jgi:metal-responsive CopG/Arc/MetJ family transcriptional regulator
MDKTPPTSRQFGMRMPLDLIMALDRTCRDNRLRRAEIVVAALRAYLGVKSPAERVAAEKTGAAP